jgi:hypothetical protein
LPGSRDGDNESMPTKTPHPHLKEELEHLHEVAAKGDAPATPAIALGEVMLFLLPIILLILGGTFAAYYLA